MRITKELRWSFIIIGSFLISCAGPGLLRLTFDQYGFLHHGSESTKNIGNTDISVRLIRPGDMYNFEQYFSFLPESLSAEFRQNRFVQSKYKPSVEGKVWEYLFSGPKCTNMLAAFQIKITNNTDHILRMNDARIYLIIEGPKAIAPIKTYDALKEKIVSFENEFLKTRASHKHYRNYPAGLIAEILEQKKQQLKLLTDTKDEILPGFSLEGLLIFPYKTSDPKIPKLSLFDITTETDSAGVPAKKNRFDFDFRREPTSMYYDHYAKRWDILESDITLK